MGKRSDMPRKNARGFYPTPLKAVEPLFPYIMDVRRYWEPCCGDGAISLRIPGCVAATDIEPIGGAGHVGDCLDITADRAEMHNIDAFITNPPWPKAGKRGDPALSIALHLSNIRPTWLLLPWDLSANKYFAGIRDRCVKIVPVGRVSWEGNGTPGKDNCGWYLFDCNHDAGPVVMARAA